VQGLGPAPRFEWCAGWLTLFPTEGWSHPVSIVMFADVQQSLTAERQAAYRQARIEAGHEALKEVAGREDFKGNHDALRMARKGAAEAALRRHGLTRDLASHSVFVGEALGSVLRIGDEMEFLRDGNGHLAYSVRRRGETVLSAGAIGSAMAAGRFRYGKNMSFVRTPMRRPPRKSTLACDSLNSSMCTSRM